MKLHVCLERSVPGLRPVCAGGIGHRKLAGIGNLEAKGTGQVPDGRGSLHAWTGPVLGQELIAAPAAVIEARLRQEAEALLDQKLPPFGTTSIVRLSSGLPVFYTGWLRRLRQRQQTLVPAPVTLAGDYLASPSMEGAIRTGQEAAERILRWLEQ